MSKVKAYIKQGSKQVAKAVEEKFKGIGRSIVATTLRAEEGVMQALLKCKGESPDHLDKVKEGIKDSWTAHAEKLKVQSAGADNEVTFKSMMQSVYNRQSEQMAVINAFKLYAKWNSKEADGQVSDEMLSTAFDEQLESITGYHKLIEFCRHVNRANKGEPITIAEVEKRKKEMKELRANTFKAIEKNLKLASIEQLQQLAQDIQARLRTLKAPTAPTLELVKAKQRKAIAENKAKAVLPKAKQRKAA